MADGAWTLTPAGLARVLAEVASGRETIVECGSGESTVAIGAELARRRCGRLWSLEHDPVWAGRTRRGIARDGLADRVELICAPLRPHALGAAWYDASAVARLPEAIDLLLVDGPPGDVTPNGLARYPALPALAARLAPGALVILDDIHRAGERAVLARWRHELGIEFELRPRERIAIGVTSAA